MKKLFTSGKSKSILSLMVVAILILSSFTSFAESFSISQVDKQVLEQKISVEVLNRFESGDKKVEVLVELKEQSDSARIASNMDIELSSSRLNTNQIKIATREAVIDGLEETAQRTQKSMLNYLRIESLKGNVSEYKSYYIVNMVYVKASQNVINNLALMANVEKVYYNDKIYLTDYTVNSEEEMKAIEDFNELQAVSPSDIEWNVKQVNADKVWNELGIDGKNVVVGMIDTGVQWDHPALKEKYRGYDAATGKVDHSKSWFDAMSGRTAPYDDTQTPHGSHCMGTILGQEPSGRNAIGVAPGAKFIVAKSLSSSGGSESQLISAGQWMLKPGGSAANAPDLISNSWGGGNGTNNWYKQMVISWRSAGIIPIFAAGNQAGSGQPSAGSIAIPSNYIESFAVGATDINNKRGIFSLLGPSPYDRNVPKPDIAAPGVNIRSSIPTGQYQGGWNGTSMACPNIAGVAALILSANPNLSVSEVESAIKNTATALTDSQFPKSPNMGYGYGLVNAFEAVKSVIGPTPDKTGTVSGKIIEKASQNGIANVTVTIEGTSLSTTTNSLGNYTIEQVPAGEQVVIARGQGLTPRSKEISVSSNVTTIANIIMVPT